MARQRATVRSSVAEVEAFCRSLAPGTLRREHPWTFYGGTSITFKTPRGSEVVVSAITTYGARVLAVMEDFDEVEERARKELDLVGAEVLGQEVSSASDPAGKIRAICALAGLRALAGGVALPQLVFAAGRLLDDSDAKVRLAAIRAVAILPAQSAAKLLEGRKDPENPRIVDWYAHYAGLLAQHS